MKLMSKYIYVCLCRLCGTGFPFMRIALWDFSMTFLFLSLPSILQIRGFLPLFQRTPLSPDRRRERLLQSHIWEDKSEVYIHRLYPERPTTDNIQFASPISIALPPVSSQLLRLCSLLCSFLCHSERICRIALSISFGV